MNTPYQIYNLIQFKTVLLQKNLTVSELARQVGISRQRFYDYFNLDRIPANRAKRIWEALDCTAVECGMTTTSEPMRLTSLLDWQLLGCREPARIEMHKGRSHLVYITTPDLMQAFKVSRQTIYNWIRNHKLPHQRSSGTRYLYRWPEVEEWAKDLLRRGE